MFWLVLSDAPARFFFTSLFGIGELFTNVLSSGLPLPAPGLSGSLFVSGLRGLGSGCAAERRLGEVVVRISLQPVPRIGCFLRLGWRGLLQPAVIHCRPDCGIPVLHGKIARIDVCFQKETLHLSTFAAFHSRLPCVTFTETIKHVPDFFYSLLKQSRK